MKEESNGGKNSEERDQIETKWMRGTLGSTVPEWMDSEIRKPHRLAMSVTFNKLRLVTPHKLGKKFKREQALT